MSVLKRSLVDAGAAHDLSHGAPSTLYDVLKDLVQTPQERLDGRVATIATGVLAEMLSPPYATRLRAFQVRVAVAGTAGQTDVQVRVNGSAVATITVPNTATDPSTTVATPDIPIPANSLVDLNVSAAPTGGTGLAASARFSNIDVEP